MAQKLQFYDKKQYKELKNRIKADGKEIVSITYFLNDSKVGQLDDKKVVDLSSLAGVLDTNTNIQFQFEQLFELFPENMMFISDIKYQQDMEFLLRYCFDVFEVCDVEVKSEEKEIKTNEIGEIHHNVKKIIDLKDDEIKKFFDSFNKSLYGHKKFKDEFMQLVETFRVFNKIGEHKILSLFLMGDSGVGKTEVARSIHRALKSKCKLAKINFGNYSSHDALNSLIGSPLGYIGSDGGELLKRVLDSDVGVILIDEFEKADTAIFNYFLDVLENGKITNSRAEEYDADGYIIIFTSNISQENFKSKISPELRSRFDYVGEFNMLTADDKNKFVRYRFGEIISKYEKSMKISLPSNAHSELVKRVNVDKYQNMRHLNKKIKDTFVSYIKQIEIAYNGNG